VKASKEAIPIKPKITKNQMVERPAIDCKNIF
jgi:hypothetical protein